MDGLELNVNTNDFICVCTVTVRSFDPRSQARAVIAGAAGSFDLRGQMAHNNNHTNTVNEKFHINNLLHNRSVL